jgi:opacity protein-like surface antigen
MADWRALVLAGCLAVVSTELASAADFLPPAPTLPPPSTEFNGWYLRGDVGFGVNPRMRELKITPDPIAAGIVDDLLSASAVQSFNSTTLSRFGMVDVGVGYQLSDWFRLDGTFEYRGGANLKSLYTLSGPAAPAFGGGPLQNDDFYRADVSSIIGLINAYVDLGTWYGVTPYVGGGFGFADNKVSGFADHGFGFANFIPLAPADGFFSGASKTSFAWALMAGLDFRINDGLKLEFGYRHLDYCSITTGASHCLAGANGGVFSSANCSGVANFVSSRNRLASNDFRLGLIYMFGQGSPPALISIR